MNSQRNQKDKYIDSAPHISRYFCNQVDIPLKYKEVRRFTDMLYNFKKTKTCNNLVKNVFSV